MNFSFFLEYALHGLCGWAVGVAIAWWIARGWKQNPAPVRVRLVRHPLRPWLMVAFGLAGPILSLVLGPMLVTLSASPANASLYVPLSFCASGGYGVLIGLAASCCTAPASAHERFRVGPPAAVIGGFIFVIWSLLPMYRFPLFINPAAIVASLFLARAIVVSKAPSQPGAESSPTLVPRPLWFALGIGFFPAAMLVVAIAELSYWSSYEMAQAFFVYGSIISVVCCFASSIMLFKRRGGGAIAGGVLLLLLNGFIAFLLGCCAGMGNSGVD